MLGRKKLKRVIWMCDKEDCSAGNTREIVIGSVIYDDICDFCHRRIHEPLTSEIDPKKDTKKKP